MRVWRLLICAFLSIQWSSWTAFAQQRRFEALAFYSQNTEPDHVQFALDAVKFLSACAASEHFTFDTTTKWDDLNDERLKSYQLIIWLNQSPTKIEQRSAFERYIQRGGAWLGFHAAAYNDKDTNWPWFVDFLVAGTTTVLDGTNNSVLSTVKTERAPFAIAVNPKCHIAVAVGLDRYLTVIDRTTLAVSSPSIAESRQ